MSENRLRLAVAFLVATIVAACTLGQADPSPSASSAPTDPLSTESSVPQTVAPSPPPSPTSSPTPVGWGPLAVEPRAADQMEILATGRVEIGNDCVVLNVEDLKYVMVWPAEYTAWNGSSILFSTDAGETVAIADGQEVEATGGPLDGDWRERIDWANAPAEGCLPTRGWRVYDVARQRRESKARGG